MFNELKGKYNLTSEELISYLKSMNSFEQHTIDRIVELYKLNNMLFDKLHIDFISSEFFVRLGINKLSYIVIIEQAQKMLCELNCKRLTLFVMLINLFQDEYNWVPYFNALLVNMNNKEFDSFIESIDISNLSNKDLRDISLVLTSKKNYRNIESIDDLNNSSLSNECSLDEYKNYYLLKKFNLSLEESTIICQKYCYSIERINNDKYSEIVNILKCLKRVVLSTSKENVDSILSNINDKQLEYPNYQTLIQSLYADEYNKVLFDPNVHESNLVDGVKVVDAGIKFNMITRAEGAFSYHFDNSNLYDKWNNNARGNYSFSASHMSNSHMLMYALQNDGLITYGFNNLDNNSIVENSLGDNATMAKRDRTLDPRSYEDFGSNSPITFDSCGQLFVPFEDMINFSSRSTHTEITLERFSYSSGEERRIQPGYIIYYILDDNYKNDDLYIKSLDTAKSFNILLVTIDFKRVLEAEKDKFNTILSNVSSNYSIDKIKELFQLYANNSIEGLKPSAQDLVNKYFPYKINDKCVCDIILEEIITTNNISKDDIQILFNYLMKLNARKNIFSNEYLYHLAEEHDLDINYEQYNSELYGIDLHKPNDCFYDFRQVQEKAMMLREFNLPFIEKYYKVRNYDLSKIIKLIKKYDLEFKEEYVFMRPHELEALVEKMKEEETASLLDELDKEEEQPIEDFGWEDDDWGEPVESPRAGFKISF